MRQLTTTQIRARMDRGDPHLAHIAMHGVAADRPSLAPQEYGDPPPSKERILDVDLIDPVFDRDLVRGGTLSCNKGWID